jgi:hypothetical protein
MPRYSFRHYRRSAAGDAVGTLIARHSCGAANVAAAVAYTKANLLGEFQIETDSADLSDEDGEVVWLIAEVPTSSASAGHLP